MTSARKNAETDFSSIFFIGLRSPVQSFALSRNVLLFRN